MQHITITLMIIDFLIFTLHLVVFIFSGTFNLASALASFSSTSNFSAQCCNSCFLSTCFPSATISANLDYSSASLGFNEPEDEPDDDLLCLLDFNLIAFPDFLSTSASLSQFLIFNPIIKFLKAKIFSIKQKIILFMQQK